MDGRLEVQLLDDVDDFRRGKIVSPDPTSVWPRVALIHEAWIAADDQTLVVGGLHGFETVLHSLDVDESEDEVGVLAKIAYTPEAARWRVEASERVLELAVGIPWRAQVCLQNPLAGRTVIDRGVLQLEAQRANQSPSLHSQVIAQLESELVGARPAERRRIRQTIKAIRRNPFKAVAWVEQRAADREPKD